MIWPIAIPVAIGLPLFGLLFVSWRRQKARDNEAIARLRGLFQ